MYVAIAETRSFSFHAETRSFSFHAAGTTREEALGVLGAAWLEHERVFGGWLPLTLGDVLDGANVVELIPGSFTRDYAPFGTADMSSSVSRQHYVDTGAYLADDDDEPHPFDMPTPAADLLSRFYADADAVQAMYDRVESDDPDAPATYDEADEAADDLTSTYLHALATHLADVIGYER